MPNWDDMRIFLAVARGESLSRAGRVLRMDPATVGRRIARLEESLGAALFAKSPQGYLLTETGQRIIEQAQRVLDQVGVIKDMAQDGKNQLNSPLKVGAIYTIGPYLFPHLLPELRRAAPDMPLYIEENYTATLRQKLRQSELDAIIIALPFEEPEVVTLPLYDEPFVVLLPGGHPLTKRCLLYTSDAADE